MNFSAILDEMRKKQGWNQTELAKEIGISQRMVSAIENKECVPSYKTALKITSLMKKLSMHQYVDNNDEGYRYDVVKFVKDVIDSGEVSRLEEDFDSDFWNYIDNRKINYSEIENLKRLLLCYKIDEYKFFSYCAVNPILVTDGYGATEILNIKIYRDILRILASGQVYNISSSDSHDDIDNLKKEISKLKEEKETLYNIVKSQQKTVENQSETIKSDTTRERSNNNNDIGVNLKTKTVKK